MKKIISLVIVLYLPFFAFAQNLKINVVGKMSDVMWYGQMGSNIKFDTISNKTNIYGMGPGAGLRGEVLMFNGECYTAYVLDEEYMEIEKGFYGSSPFFAYSNINKWQEVKLPSKVKDIKQLELFLASKAKKYKQPFIFKLEGKVDEAIIHVVNLTRGAVVSKPEDAHRGKVTYRLFEKQSDILGFYSQNHQSVFTHHDSFMHMHLITSDKTKLGHVDEIKINPKNMKLFIAIE